MTGTASSSGEAASGFGVEEFKAATNVSRETLDRLSVYVEMLGQWQKRMNLVSPRSLPDVWHRHMFDSAQLLPLVADDRKAHARPLVWLDIGSGAGFPALVIAIMTGERVHLVEKSPKKSQFLNAVIREIGVDAVVHNARVEDVTFGEDLEGRIDIVTARACAPLPRLLELAYPLLSRGALGLFLKGQHLEEELTQATKCWRMTYRTYNSRTSVQGRTLRVEEIARV